MKIGLNGTTKWVAGLVFGAGMLYATTKIGLKEQAVTRLMAIRNDTRLTRLETKFELFMEDNIEIKRDIKTLLKRR